MSTTREEKRAELQNRLIEAAQAQIAAHGLAGLKAREVTAQAGCALGALYNAFDDLDMLVVHVNARTLARLGAVLRESAAQAGDDPEAVLQALAARYTDFALAERALWLALFEHRLPEGVEVPEWHRREHEVLIEVIVPPLAALRPDLPREALILRARTVFAATHGVVALAVQGRFVGVPMAHLHAEVAGLVQTMARGARAAVAG